MMRINIKTKLSLGLGFLFAVIILIGSMGAVYIHAIASESKEILKDNYESIQYARAMLHDMDLPGTETKGTLGNFEKNLILQEHNITEAGEGIYTRKLRQAFDSLRGKGFSSKHVLDIRTTLYKIMDLNMQAILKKNRQAQATGDRVLAYIGIIGGICFIIVFTFIINFPGYIADPIRQLTASIREIAARNYTQRLHFKSGDEFDELASAFNSMAQELQKYESSNLATIMFEKKRIEAIVNNMNDAIIGLNEHKVFLFINIRAAQLFGLHEADVLGRYAPDVAAGNDLVRLLLSHHKQNAPLRIFADGKESYFNKEVIAISSEGKAIGEVILLKNITRFQELDQAKTNFIATISHELKTPIASIKLSSKLLEDDRIGGLNEEQKQLVANIKEDSERLLKITAEVLNMAQVETGRISLSIQAVSVADIIRYATDALKFQTGQKNMTIDINIPEGLPLVNADLEKTAWVMVNLLSNAIRYSEEQGRIIVGTMLQGNEVEFSVRDFGKGIDLQYHDKIFDRFFQVPGSKTGSGLGLAISKEFIMAQHGSIGLKDASPGAAFFFCLPVAV